MMYTTLQIQYSENCHMCSASIPSKYTHNNNFVWTEFAKTRCNLLRETLLLAMAANPFVEISRSALTEIDKLSICRRQASLASTVKPVYSKQLYKQAKTANRFALYN